MIRKNCGVFRMENWIDELNEKWYEYEQNMKMDEENVKNHFVIPFLKQIGYTEEKVYYDYEYKCDVGRVDVYLKIKGTDEGIYVETKRGHLTSENIKQIVNYMDVSNKNILWGILTNGKKYYLIYRDIISERNNSSEDALLDKVILVGSLNKKSKNEREAIKYFSKEYLFDSKKTMLMKEIAQFKAYKTYGDWRVYFSTLFGFFDFYCEELEKNLIITAPETRKYLSDIREREFEQYLLTLRPKSKNKEKLSQDIIKSKCSHITEMYREFERRNLIITNNFRNTRTNILDSFFRQGIIQENKEEVKNYLFKENISVIIKNFEEKDKIQSVIRSIIFCLIAYYGFTKSQVVEFLSQPWVGTISFDEMWIEYQGIRKNMPLKLAQNFMKIKKVTGRRKYILGDSGERGQSISIDIVSATFDEIKKMKNVEGRSYFTPEYTRKMLIVALFEEGFSIEEISGFVGISLNSIEKIIGKDKISQIGLKRWKMRNSKKSKHPFEEEFNV